MTAPTDRRLVESIADLAALLPLTTLADADVDPVVRAHRNAAHAAVAVASDPGRDSEDATAVTDLLANLRHLCDALALDFDDLVDQSDRYYREEAHDADCAGGAWSPHL